MDYEARIVKLETSHETIKEEFSGVKRELIRLDQKIDALREHTDRRIDGLHQEIAKLTRWTTGLILFNATAILGLASKLMGLV